jgi:hypothetical protein
MTEIHFLVEDAAEGGFIARAMGADIFTEAGDMQAMHAQVPDTVQCHFDAGAALSIIRLHISGEEGLAA